VWGSEKNARKKARRKTYFGDREKVAQSIGEWEGEPKV